MQEHQKYFWEKPLKEEYLKSKLESAPVPANCQFLTPKKTNTEIWVTLPGSVRSHDCKLQDIQKIFTTSTILSLKAASELTNILQSLKQGKPITDKDIKTPMTSLKDSLSLAGKVNQSINQLRRYLIKPSLPSQYSKLADLTDESAEHLFGDSISEKLDSLNKENQLKSLLTDKNQPSGKLSKIQGKRRYYQSDVSNSKSSSKTQKRTYYNQGQKSNPNNNKNHSRYNNNNRYHSHNKMTHK